MQLTDFAVTHNSDLTEMVWSLVRGRNRMRRREFITLLGVTATWSVAARAQQRVAMRRLGVLMTFTPDDAVGQARVAALLQGLQQTGWEIGHNLGIDIRWSGGTADGIRRHAAELVALAPDVSLANGCTS